MSEEVPERTRKEGDVGACSRFVYVCGESRNQKADGQIGSSVEKAATSSCPNGLQPVLGPTAPLCNAMFAGRTIDLLRVHTLTVDAVTGAEMAVASNE